MNDPVEDVRATAIRAFGNMRDVRTIDILVKILDDKSPVVQRAAVEVLGGFRDRRLTVPLMKMLKSRDKGVVERTIEALGRLGDKKTEEALAYFAVKGTPTMRALAIRSLGNLEI
jgi:HEAT repeat protein